MGQKRDAGCVTVRLNLGDALACYLGELFAGGSFVNRGIGDENCMRPRRDHREAEDFGSWHRINRKPDVVMTDRVAARQPGDHRVYIPMHQHTGGKYVTILVHQALAIPIEIAVTLQPLIQVFDIMTIAARKGGIMDFDIVGTVQPEPLDCVFHMVFATDQHRGAKPRLRKRDRRAD